ncbi:hypothetical protein CI238_12519 [Colletotrichum incanum]|uniref:Uncharacterized protein n=1 Tax=Colletotrichum incanum TaxID=1573173 RepID=A0A167BB12_COLIC|nr:hypothetical protein CI238_12519 [Colletotrichum incanum]
MSLPNVRNTNVRLAAGTESVLEDGSVTTVRPSRGDWPESQRLIPRQAPRITNANAFLQKLWVPRLPNGMEKETERSRQRALHTSVMEAIKLPGILLGPDGYFSSGRGPRDLKASLDVDRCTIHIQVTHANQVDLNGNGTYKAAYSALILGGWLVHIEAHPQPEVSDADSSNIIYPDSGAHQPVDLVPGELRQNGFTSLHLCTGRTRTKIPAVDGIEAQAHSSAFWEMQVESLHA